MKIIHFSDEADRLRCERSAAGEAVEKRLSWLHGITEFCLALLAGAVLLGILSALGMQGSHWFLNVIYFLILSLACWTTAQGPRLTKLTKRIALGMFGGYINRPLARFVQQFSVSELAIFLTERYPASIDAGVDLVFRRSQYDALDKIIADKKSANNEELLQKLKPKQDEIKKIANAHHAAKAEELTPLQDQLELEAEEIKILEIFQSCRS